MKGISSKEFLEALAKSERSFRRLRKFVALGGPVACIEDEILLLINHAIELRWVTRIQPAETLEPKE